MHAKAENLCSGGSHGPRAAWYCHWRSPGQLQSLGPLAPSSRACGRAPESRLTEDTPFSSLGTTGQERKLRDCSPAGLSSSVQPDCLLALLPAVFYPRSARSKHLPSGPDEPLILNAQVKGEAQDPAIIRRLKDRLTHTPESPVH